MLLLFLSWGHSQQQRVDSQVPVPGPHCEHAEQVLLHLPQQPFVVSKALSADDPGGEVELDGYAKRPSPRSFAGATSELGPHLARQCLVLFQFCWSHGYSHGTWTNQVAHLICAAHAILPVPRMW